MGIKITNLPTTPVNDADYIPVANTTNGTRKVLMQDVLAVANVEVDSALDISSDNPVENSAVTAAINAIYSSLSSASITDDGDGNITISFGSGSGSGGGDSVTVDSALSSTSENPVQNKAIYSALQDKANTSAIPTNAADVGAIAAPSSPTSGQFLVYDGTAWTAMTLATWQGGSY